MSFIEIILPVKHLMIVKSYLKEIKKDYIGFVLKKVKNSYILMDIKNQRQHFIDVTLFI